jgi:hypothetical protein
VSQLNAQKYRERSAQCLALAERARRDDDKSTWLELAGKWQRLADEAGSRDQRAQQPQSQPGSKRSTQVPRHVRRSASRQDARSSHDDNLRFREGGQDKVLSRVIESQPSANKLCLRLLIGVRLDEDCSVRTIADAKGIQPPP